MGIHDIVICCILFTPSDMSDASYINSQIRLPGASICVYVDWSSRCPLPVHRFGCVINVIITGEDIHQDCMQRTVQAAFKSKMIVSLLLLDRFKPSEADTWFVSSMEFEPVRKSVFEWLGSRSPPITHGSAEDSKFTVNDNIIQRWQVFVRQECVAGNIPCDTTPLTI